MERIAEGAPIPPWPDGAVVTVGTFDGVHLGHERVLAETVRLAHERRCPAVVVTFAGSAEPDVPLLTTMVQRIERFEALGVDAVVVAARPAGPAEDFLRAVVGAGPAPELVSGPRYRFGSAPDGFGDVATLEDIAASVGVKVDAVGPVLDDRGQVVSTPGIRAALAAGDIEGAIRGLGREPEIEGVVEHGDRRGRTIGFPTANVATAADVQLPADGVYAGWYQRPDGRIHRSAVSIGRRPTFYEENGLLLVEAYLLDFDGDLYDETARVRISERIRGQLRFDSVDELVVQMNADVARTREGGARGGSV